MSESRGIIYLDDQGGKSVLATAASTPVTSDFTKVTNDWFLKSAPHVSIAHDLPLKSDEGSLNSPLSVFPSGRRSV